MNLRASLAHDIKRILPLLVVGLAAACLAWPVRPAMAEEDSSDDDVSEEETLTFLKKHAPEMLEELDRIRDEEPEEYEEHLQDLAEQVAGYKEVSKHSPELADSYLKTERLEFKSWQTADRIAEAEGEAREKLITQLRETLAEIYEARLFQQEMELKELQHEVGEMQRVIDQRRAHRESILDRRLKEMTAERDEIMDW